MPRPSLSPLFLSLSPSLVPFAYRLALHLSSPLAARVPIRPPARRPARPSHRYGAIVLYTGNSCYRELNRALREVHSEVSFHCRPLH